MKRIPQRFHHVYALQAKVNQICIAVASAAVRSLSVLYRYLIHANRLQPRAVEQCIPQGDSPPTNYKIPSCECTTRDHPPEVTPQERQHTRHDVATVRDTSSQVSSAMATSTFRPDRAELNQALDDHWHR
nr:hypothetical protein CFP56_12962 [Quercus suber]